MNRFPPILILAAALLCSASPALACRQDVPLVKQSDLLQPPTEPTGVAALRGAITQIVPANGPLDVRPHGGFRLDLMVIKVYQGDITGKTISVEYGGCHSVPGKVGDIIPVLAVQDKNGEWIAPQAWKR